ncbi:hypothetical protein R3P38DRAFT_2517855 [Favolaschia claudopus]|uniref:Uncharacterized protein n=1 Tax=Favolaschia claudopus TaxID=2862362 RepID=A0AAW0CB58_9AGAR
MYHPYSNEAGYIYANEHPYTPVNAHHNVPYGRMQSFISNESADSLPISHPYSPQNTMTWTASNSWTRTTTRESSVARTQSHFSEDPESPYRRSRRDSNRPLLPVRLFHPYSQPLDEWIDEESIVDSPIVPNSPAVGIGGLRPKRAVSIKDNRRYGSLVPGYQDWQRDSEREKERDTMRRAAAWRRKIQVRI